MNNIKISIGGKQYNVRVAVTEKEQERGLQGETNLAPDEGMLFIFPEPQDISFWMKDTSIPLDIIFIDENLEVTSVSQAQPNTEIPHTGEMSVFVLEVNQNSGIKVGDTLEFSPLKHASGGKMQVLDSNGETQMELEGGERIFSRANTKILIKFAKKADALKRDSDYKQLGNRLFKFLQIQEDTPAEYVSK